MNRHLLVLLMPFFCLPMISFAQEKPAVMLAKTYDEQSVDGWLASEKLDGVRAYWDGSHLVSRQGNIFPAPADFTIDFPIFPLDGELYIGRGQFAQTSGRVRSPDDWSDIRYYVFDVPNAEGGLLERLSILEKWLVDNPNKHIVIIKQTVITGIDEAQKMREEIENLGGEGLILRNPDSPYLPARTETMLKLKSFADAECVVRQHISGKGKLVGKLGAVLCELDDGKMIKIGSGFSHTERANPPPIGAKITYRYNGFTKTGKPRFARFWRVREKN